MHGARGTGGRSSKHRSLISSISRKKKKSLRRFLFLSDFLPAGTLHFCKTEVKAETVLLWALPFLLLATYPHRIQRNKEKSYFGECQRCFFNLITWRGDFVELIHHKELRILDKTTAIFSLILPFFAWSFGANSANCLNGVGTIPGVQVQSLNISLPRELSGGELWDSYLGKSTVTISQGRTQNQEMW